MDNTNCAKISAEIEFSGMSLREFIELRDGGKFNELVIDMLIKKISDEVRSKKQYTVEYEYNCNSEVATCRMKLK